MIEGRCRCGACRLTIVRDALPPVYACHCHQCQRASGSAFSLQALVAETSVTLVGPITVYEHRTDDRTSVQRFCATRHTRMYNSNTRRPGVAVVRAGILDRSEELVCAAHIFTAFRQRWFDLPGDRPAWPEMPPVDAFMAAIAGQ